MLQAVRGDPRIETSEENWTEAAGNLAVIAPRLVMQGGEPVYDSP